MASASATKKSLDKSLLEPALSRQALDPSVSLRDQSKSKRCVSITETCLSLWNKLIACNFSADIFQTVLSAPDRTRKCRSEPTIPGPVHCSLSMLTFLFRVRHATLQCMWIITFWPNQCLMARPAILMPPFLRRTANTCRHSANSTMFLLCTYRKNGLEPSLLTRCQLPRTILGSGKSFIRSLLFPAMTSQS